MTGQAVRRIDRPVVPGERALSEAAVKTSVKVDLSLFNGMQTPRAWYEPSWGCAVETSLIRSIQIRECIECCIGRFVL